ncbi:unnamed protein product [Mucor hiemalis]
MLEMLKRLEDENDPDDLLEDDQDDDDEHQKLFERFGNIDIENTDPSLIWDLLSDKERKEFEVVLTDLEHTGNWDKLNLPTYIPWWKQPIPLITDEELIDEESDIPQLPATLPNFEKMTQPATRSSPHLAWNLLNILATYSYLMRHTLGDLLEDIKDTIDIAQDLSAHVLYSNAPECPYTSVPDVVGDIVESIIKLEDRSDLNKRGKLNSQKRYDLKILILEDLEALLKECRPTRKLYFYFAAACYLNRERSDILTMAIKSELSKTKVEKEDFQRDFDAAQDAIKQHQQQKENDSKVKIQEL